MKDEEDFTRNFLRSKEAFLMAVVLFVAAVAPVIIILVTKPVTVNYWDSAPNGIYHILAYRLDNDTIICPMCSHSGSELHGTWHYVSGLEIPDNRSGTWMRVLLVNNTILFYWG